MVQRLERTRDVLIVTGMALTNARANATSSSWTSSVHAAEQQPPALCVKPLRA
jgi:hypothetical protein